MIPVLINVLLSLLTLCGFILCGFYSLFRNSALLADLEAIKSSYAYGSYATSGERFTFFMAQRKLDWWTVVATELAGKSMLLSLVIGVFQWGTSLKSGVGLKPVAEFLENPGFLFYAQFALISYVSISMAIIDYTVRLFSRIK